MPRNHDVTGDRRSWWFWPTVIVVIAAVVALIAWTLVQTGTVGDSTSIGSRPGNPMTAIATTAIS